MARLRVRRRRHPKIEEGDGLGPEAPADEIVIRVTKEEGRRLREQAEVEGRSIPLLVQDAAVKYLDSRSSGCVHDEGDVTPEELEELGLTQEQLDEWAEEFERT